MSALLEADALTKRFGGVTAVDGCSFTVEEGTITAMIGPNGSGKTTVFNMLTGYMGADGGGVAFRGRRMRRPDPTRLYRDGLTRTFQQARVFPQLTVVENMAVAVAQPWRGVVRRAVGRGDRRTALAILEEFGLAGHAEQPAANLSYGQKKLLEFATVLMSEPRIVLLDEPTAGVNPVMVDRIEARIRDLHGRGLTLLVVEHHMNLVMGVSDHVVCLDFGRKIAEGPPSEVQRDQAVIEAYLGTAEADGAA